MLLKEELHATCCALIEQKLGFARQNLYEIRESLLNETKSTAGDKHETSRAMAQLEMEKSSKQVHELELLQKSLVQLDPTKKSVTIQSGSLVKTDKGWFYISIALGKIMSNDISFTVLSIASPLGQQFLSKKAGDIIQFNTIAYTIIEVG